MAIDMATTDRRLSGCLYCGNPGPYTDEHVICAGLGGDDKNWMLRSLVCKVCNTDVFSKLEVKFLRSSPVALARLFLQPRTRDRGKATGVPSLQSSVSYIHDVSTDTLLEAIMEAGGVARVLPQIGTLPQLEIFRVGPDADSLASLIKDISTALTDSITLLKKRREGAEVKFDVTPLNWHNEQYAVGRTHTSAVRPKGGIWLESLERPATEPQGSLLPRAFRRPGGHLTCRADGPEQAAQFLSTLRRSPEALHDKAVADEDRRVSHNGVHQRLNFDVAAYDRVLTKTGLNLVSHLLGAEVLRQTAFDRTVEYARSGVGNIRKYRPEVAAGAANLLGRALPDRHLFGLFQIARPQGGTSLVFYARLYGGPLEGIILSDSDTVQSWLSEPVIVHVNYVTHSIARLTLLDHVLELNHAYPDDPIGLGSAWKDQNLTGEDLAELHLKQMASRI